MAKSTRASAQGKTRKHRFPLWLHTPSGQWCKKIRKRLFYFGTDKDKALEEYTRERANLEAGNPRRPDQQAGDLLSLHRLVNDFLVFKRHQVATCELTQRSFSDYYDSCERLLAHFGKEQAVSTLAPTDLLAYREKLAKTRGPHAIGTEVGRVRVLLRFAFEQAMIDRPIRFGEFKKPSKAAFRRSRAEVGVRLFERPELLRILESSDPLMRAMVLLGVNCGFGNADVGTLPQKAIDWRNGWINYPRPKTGIERRCPLWPETVDALKKAIDQRPNPKNPDHDGLAFLTKYGLPWHQDNGKRQSPLSAEFRKLLTRLDLYRRGLSFYTLRHVFQTTAEEIGDETATRLIMGHTDASMSAVYRERFPDARLQRVAQHVHDWLFPTVATAERKDGDA